MMMGWGLVSGGGLSGVPWVVPGFAEERELGRGGSGRVVAGVHLASGTRVAIKYLLPRLLGDPGFISAFRAEADLLRSLDVPHVVRLFEYVEAPDRAGVDRGSSPGGLHGAAIVMELVDGVSLFEMITQQGPTTAESALAVLKGSLQGLAAAHSLGIVHRDYKPENVLVDRSGTSKLTDFGVAVRSGQDAPFGGTAFYMAPEQWDGTPATPATDIYAATAVFFECLTGKTPFSGEPLQLAAQHAAASVPVELVDEPLRELIARGMAKSPAARPANATDFVAELETTAAAAYGQDWEERGRSHLAERAAALLLLLLRSPAAVGSGTGTTNVTTTLAPKAPVGAAKGGLGSWQVAALYVGIFVVVFGSVAGALVGTGALTSNSHSASSAAAAGASGRPAASPTATTAATTAACGSTGLPPLAYVTELGSTTPTTQVLVRCGTGAPHVVTTLHNDTVENLAWSLDGTQLAWTTGQQTSLYVAQVKAGTWTLRQVTCDCIGVAFLGDQPVSVNAKTAGGPMSQQLAQAQLLVFPKGGGQSTTLPLTGIDNNGRETEFRLLGSVSPTQLLVDYGDGGGSDLGGFQSLYKVNSGGQATRYGPATPSTTRPGASTIFGLIGNVTVSPAGTQVAFATYSRGGACGASQPAQLLDTATGVISTPATPPGGGSEGYWVLGTWFDGTGTPYASLVPNQSTCSTTGVTPTSPIEPAGAAPTVVKLSGGSWVKAGSGIIQAAYGPGKWLAEQVGTTPIANSPGYSLTISGGTGTTPVTVQSVVAFAWAS
jgi:eukaryotic-like serine/threonine-protein kinase